MSAVPDRERVPVNASAPGDGPGALENLPIPTPMMPTSEVVHHQSNGNGARAASPWPYTQPAVLDQVEELRDELHTIARRIDWLLTVTESAAEFVGYRVEAARVRERRRDRRGRRKAMR
jgi:hypothetical protein